MAKFKFNPFKLQEILNDYAEIRKVTIPDAVHLNARLLCVELARRTQPFGNDDKTNEVGQLRVLGDIAKVVKRPVDLLKAVNKVENDSIRKRLKTLLLNNDFAVISIIFKNMGFMQKDVEMLKSSIDLKTAHTANRNKSTGRTKSPSDKYYIAPSSLLDEYTKKLQKRVGFSKAAWASCAMQLKKIISGSQTRGIPKWVTEDMADYGEVIDNTNNLENPHVSMTNKIPWASTVCPPIEVVQAQMVVGQKMKNQMAQILKKRNKGLVEL